ncbi:hypothetical protein FGADI_1341 [Fusarium gaditjirri]|uniref:Uncharacterized protein n=1 Tax=Fusarium gaditjirri TaxID=282569 RepID=A0A8H4X2S7_9HYPO|nr:hypothetical protein FGADI_1341 [Fusarium gaditjirri]
MVGGLEEEDRIGRGRHINTSGPEVTVTETSDDGPRTVEQGIKHGDVPSHADHSQNEAIRDMSSDREMAASANLEAVDDVECDTFDPINDVEILGDRDEPSAVGTDSENEKMTEDVVDSHSEYYHAGRRDDDGFEPVGSGDHIEAYGNGIRSASMDPSESDADLHISLLDVDTYQNHGASTQNTYDNDTRDDSNASVPCDSGAFFRTTQKEVNNPLIDLTGDDEVDTTSPDGDTSSLDGGYAMLTKTGPGDDGLDDDASIEEIDPNHNPGSRELTLAPGVRRNPQTADLNSDEEGSRATKRQRTADHNTSGGSTGIRGNANLGPTMDNVDVVPVTNVGAGNLSTMQWLHMTHGKESGIGFNPEILHRLTQTGRSDVRRWSTNIRFGGFCMFVLHVLPPHHNASDLDVENLAESISTWARNELNNNFAPVIENGITVGYAVNDTHVEEATATARNDEGDEHDDEDMVMAFA